MVRVNCIFRIDDFEISFKIAECRKLYKKKQQCAGDAKIHPVCVFANQSNQFVSIKVFDVIRMSTAVPGLSHWLPDHIAKPLTEDEERFTVAYDDLPEDIQALSPGRKYRLAIIDKKTGDTRLEYEFGENRQTLLDPKDTGGAAWTNQLVKYYFWGLRGSEHPDSTHRRVRSWVNATKASGCTTVMTEMEVVVSYLFGPWKSKFFWREFVTALQDSF